MSISLNCSVFIHHQLALMQFTYLQVISPQCTDLKHNSRKTTCSQVLIQHRELQTLCCSCLICLNRIPMPASQLFSLHSPGGAGRMWEMERTMRQPHWIMGAVVCGEYCTVETVEAANYNAHKGEERQGKCPRLVKYRILSVRSLEGLHHCSWVHTCRLQPLAWDRNQSTDNLYSEHRSYLGCRASEVADSRVPGSGLSAPTLSLFF